MKTIGDRVTIVSISLLVLFTMIVCFNLDAQEIKNLARNADFENGTIEWKIRKSEGTIATIEEDKKESIKGKASVFIKIDLAKGTYWHISLFQEGHFLKGGKKYTFAVWAKGEKPRPMILYIEEVVDPWDEFGRKQVTISKEWEEYWSTFTAPKKVPAAWLRIALGESDVNLWVDNVRFYEGEYVEEKGLKRIRTVEPIGKLATAWGDMKRR